MFIPKSFEVTDTKPLHDLIDAGAFGILVGVQGLANHKKH